MVLPILVVATVSDAAENSASVNFVWISPRFVSPSAPFQQPIPLETIRNIKHAAERNPSAYILIWIDSRRLSKPQMEYLRTIVSGAKNMKLKDLRSIPKYSAEPLFNQEDQTTDWRSNKQSLIWRQVDAARILVTLQPGYEQTYYSDTDVTNLIVRSDAVQRIINQHGVILAGGVSKGTAGDYAWYENQMFGFDARMQPFFHRMYEASVRAAYEQRENGYGAYIDLINNYLKQERGINTKNIVFRVKFDGTVAHHPSEKSTAPFCEETITNLVKTPTGVPNKAELMPGQLK